MRGSWERSGTIESARLFTRTLPSRKLRRVWTFTGGRGATVGSVNPTKGAIIPAAVGVDIGYGTEAKRRITLKQHTEAMKGIEARLDGGVLDESAPRPTRTSTL